MLGCRQDDDEKVLKLQLSELTEREDIKMVKRKMKATGNDLMKEALFENEENSVTDTQDDDLDVLFNEDDIFSDEQAEDDATDADCFASDSDDVLDDFEITLPERFLEDGIYKATISKTKLVDNNERLKITFSIMNRYENAFATMRCVPDNEYAFILRLVRCLNTTKVKDFAGKRLLISIKINRRCI